MSVETPAITDEATIAARDAALDSLSDLVRYVRRLNSYMSEPDQQTYRRALAVLVEAGRKI